MRADVKVSGHTAVAADLGALAQDLDDLRATHDALASEIAGDAQSLVKVASGALRATIRPVSVPGAAVVVAGGPSAPYAMVRDQRDGFLRNPANDETRAHRHIEDGVDNAVRDHF